MKAPYDIKTQELLRELSTRLYHTETLLFGMDKEADADVLDDARTALAKAYVVIETMETRPWLR